MFIIVRKVQTVGTNGTEVVDDVAVTSTREEANERIKAWRDLPTTLDVTTYYRSPRDGDGTAWCIAVQAMPVEVDDYIR